MPWRASDVGHLLYSSISWVDDNGDNVNDDEDRARKQENVLAWEWLEQPRLVGGVTEGATPAGYPAQIVGSSIILVASEYMGSRERRKQPGTGLLAHLT